MNIIIVLLLNILYSNNIESQISPDIIYIGTPIIISSYVNFDNEFILLDDFNLYDKNIQLDSIYTINKKIIRKMKIWESGEYIIPKMKFFILNNEKNIIDSNYVPLVTIKVDTSIIVSNQIIQNRGLILPNNHNVKKQFVYIFLLILISTYLIILFSKKNIKEIKQSKKNNSYRKSHAINDINNLKIVFSSNYTIETFYSKLSNIFKNYISSKFFINSTKMTSEEILAYLKRININEKLFIDIKLHLKGVDIKKYSLTGANDIQIIEDKKKCINIIENIDKI